MFIPRFTITVHRCQDNDGVAACLQYKLFNRNYHQPATSRAKVKIYYVCNFTRDFNRNKSLTAINDTYTY